MSEKDFALMAHLMRRAGFGATREELEQHGWPRGTRPQWRSCCIRNCSRPLWKTRTCLSGTTLTAII